MTDQHVAVVGTQLPEQAMAVVRSRQRSFTITADVTGDAAALRGLVVGPGVDVDQGLAWLDAVVAAEVPALLYGPVARTVLQAGARERALVQMRLTDAGAKDPMTAGSMPGALLPSAAVPPAEVPPGLEALCVDEADSVLLARKGSAYVTLCDLDVWTSDEGQEAIQPFVDAQIAAIVGRWIDLGVGRTDDEKPWGRRGPTPVPGVGLSLHPA